MSDENIHMLAGAYALDALPLEERDFFARHLAACEACRADVADYQATAARLGGAVAESPPPQLRARVLDAVDQVRQVSPSPPPEPTFADRGRPYLSVVAAVLAFAVVVIGSVTLLVTDGAETMLAENDTGLPAWLADADIIEVEGVDGADGWFVFSEEHDEGWLALTGLDPLDPGEHSYQAWLFHDGAPVPAGVFMTDDRGTAVVRAEASVRGAELVAVTREPAGGLPEPSGEVLVSSEL